MGQILDIIFVFVNIVVELADKSEKTTYIVYLWAKLKHKKYSIFREINGFTKWFKCKFISRNIFTIQMILNFLFQRFIYLIIIFTVK